MTRTLDILLAMTLSALCGARLCAQTTGHLYVTNEESGSISLYDMNSSTGELVSVTTFSTPPRPISLSFNSTGTYAYLTSSGQSPAITKYSVDATSGTLTQIGSVDLSSGALPVAEVDPTGSYLLVMDIRKASLSSYHLNSDGSVTAASAGGVPSLTTQVVFSPAAGVAYGGGASSSLTLFSFSSSTGAVSKTGSIALSPLGEPGPGVEAPVGKMISLQPSGHYLYVTDALSGTITAFSVSPNSGALTQLPGAPYSLTSFMPTSPVFAASGTFLYFGNWDAGMIMGLKVNPNGSLSALQAAPTVTPFVTKSSRGGNIVLVADPSGKFLYALSADTDQITGFAVDQATGALNQIPGLLLSTGAFPSRAVFAP